MDRLDPSLLVSKRLALAATLALTAIVSLAPSAWAQAPVVGDPAPVTPTPVPAGAAGLYGQYWGPALATIPAAAGVPAGAPNLAQIDPVVDFANATFPGVYNNADMFVCRWIGFVKGPITGTVTFYTNTDDGVELIVNNVAPSIISNWTDHGPTDNQGNFDMVAGTLYPIQLTFYERGGGAECHLTWSYTGQARVVIPTTNLVPPAFPTAPTLTATSPPSAPPPQVTLNWTAPAGATGYILSRSTTSAAAGFTVYQMLATNSFVDLGVVFGTQYWYQVQATSFSNLIIGPVSNTDTATPILPPVTASPNTGLQTNENGAQAVFQIKFNQAAGAGVVVTVSSNNLGEGTVSTTFNAGVVTPTATGFTVQVAAGTSPTIPVTVTGVDDSLVDGNVAYTVSVAASNMGVVIPDVQLVNNDNDVAGITFSRTAGITTTEDGGADTFAVVLNRQPFGTVTMTLFSSNVLEGTVSPTTLTFTSAPGAPNGWNFPHVVTVTGVDDTVLDFTQPYAIITNPLTFSDPRDANAFALAGATNPPDVACVNLDNEQIPALPHVWGGSGSGGGCGLTGLEAVLLLGAGAAWRRRRRRNA